MSCTSSVAAPVADIFGTAALGALAVLFFLGAGQEGIEEYRGELVSAGLLSLAGAGTSVFSAMHGFAVSADCRAAHRAQLGCQSGVEESCQRSSPPTPAAIPSPAPPPEISPVESPPSPPPGQ